MIILYTSDLHLDPKHLDRLLEAAQEQGANAVIIGGDLIPSSGRTIASYIESQRRWLREILIPRLESFRRAFPNVPFYLDFGNDDLMAARPLLQEKDGKDINLLHGRVFALDDTWALAGYMFVPPTPFAIKDWEKPDCPDRTGLDGDIRSSGYRTDTGQERPYRLTPSEGTIEDDLQEISETLQTPPWRERAFILVTHCPPLNTALDQIGDGRHVGSLAIRRFIERWGTSGRLRLSLHGHIHEGPWISGKICDRIAGVPCYNVGQKHGELRALLFDLEDIEGSTKPIIVGERT